jgi:hypothetical protein
MASETAVCKHKPIVKRTLNAEVWMTLAAPCLSGQGALEKTGAEPNAPNAAPNLPAFKVAVIPPSKSSGGAPVPALMAFV